MNDSLRPTSSRGVSFSDVGGLLTTVPKSEVKPDIVSPVASHRRAGRRAFLEDWGIVPPRLAAPVVSTRPSDTKLDPVELQDVGGLLSNPGRS